MDKTLFKYLPSVDSLLQELDTKAVGIPHAMVVSLFQQVLAEFREGIDAFTTENLADSVLQVCQQRLTDAAKGRLRNVINGTGIVLHTGLGRAPISHEVLLAMANEATGYMNVELQLSDGKRGERNDIIAPYLNALVGAEDGIAVNNNAAAVLLMLNSLAEGKEVIISRGQQIEIGGSFRLPEVINKSGCKMVEIGATNKTHLLDYEKAIGENTAAVLLAHTSNYKVLGFQKSIGVETLAPLCRKHGVPLLVDLGSGALINMQQFGLPSEPLVSHYIKAGADLLSFSGDKLMGGVQAGFICGRREFVQKLQANNLYRALRQDKFSFFITEKILRSFTSSKKFQIENLALTLLTRPLSRLDAMAQKIVDALPDFDDRLQFSIVESKVETGSGTLPLETLPSRALALRSQFVSPDALAGFFRSRAHPIVGYIRNDIFHIDLKAVLDSQIAEIQHVLCEDLPQWLNS